MQFFKRDINRQNRNGEVTFYNVGDTSSQSSSSGVTLDQVRRNFVSIEFFKKLFQAHDSTDSENILNIDPNDTDSTITDLEFKFGSWSSYFISALGRNSSGGGGGGSVGVLNDLDDVDTTGAANGKVLTYQNGMWVPGTGGGSGSVSWADITDKPTTLSGYGITDAIPLGGSNYITGTLRPNTNNSINLGSSNYRWSSVYGVNGSFSSSLTVGGTDVSLDGHTHSASDITSGTFAAARIPSLDASKITSGTFATARIPTNISITGNAATATTASKLSTSSSYSVFGQTYWNNGVPQTVGNNAVGSMQYLVFRNHANNYNAGYVGAGNDANNDIALLAYSGYLYIGAGGTTMMTLDGTNVGIGTSSPVAKLHVNGTGRFENTVAVYGSNHSVRIRGNQISSTDTTYYDFGLHLGSGHINRGFYQWSPSSKWLLYFNANDTIMNHGNVGIGTDSPGYKLHVNGIIANNNKIISDFAPSANTYIKGVTDAVLNCTSTSSYVPIFNAPTSNGRISLASWLGGGDRICLIYCPQSYIDNNTNAYDHSVYWNASTGCLGVDLSNPSQKLHVSGNILATGAVTALSDMRRKSPVSEVNTRIEDLAKLPIFYYKWKMGYDDDMHIGTSAQDVQKLFPELVIGKEDLSVNYPVLGTTLGILNSRKLTSHEKEIKALKKENKALKERIKALEDRV